MLPDHSVYCSKWHLAQVFGSINSSTLSVLGSSAGSPQEPRRNAALSSARAENRGSVTVAARGGISAAMLEPAESTAPHHVPTSSPRKSWSVDRSFVRVLLADHEAR